MLTQTLRLFFHVGVFLPFGFKQLLKAMVTNNTLSCLIVEIVLLQDVDKGSVKLCWCMVDVVDTRSQGWSNVVVLTHVTHRSLGCGYC